MHCLILISSTFPKSSYNNLALFTNVFKPWIEGCVSASTIRYVFIPELFGSLPAPARRLNQVRRRQEDQSPLLGRQPIRHCPLPRAPLSPLHSLAPISRISKVSVRLTTDVDGAAAAGPMGGRTPAPNGSTSPPPFSLPLSIHLIVPSL